MLLERLSRLGGICSRVVLIADGHHPRAIDAAIRRGDLTRIRKGWVALENADSAAVAAIRAGGRLSCLSLLARSGVWVLHDDSIHLRTTAKRARLSADGMRVHRLVLPLAEAAVDTVPAAVACAVRCQSMFDAVATLDSVLNRGLMTRSQLLDALTPLPQRHRDLLTLTDGSAQSGLETKVRLGLRYRRVKVRSQVWIPGLGRVDLLVGDRLIIEVDGYQTHGTPAGFQEDRRRDREAASQGYIVLRFTYWDVCYDWERCLEAILDIVRRDGHRRSH
ncbi:endonuclease domain-containing protein [Cnuibacter sp. UC19_7]|uniref:endonuclease domain-containing protein n=1 Tax=Cnuibacter sp. UC19_7 TaxID=3350166 RepID=UPI00366B0984